MSFPFWLAFVLLPAARFVFILTDRVGSFSSYPPFDRRSDFCFSPCDYPTLCDDSG